MTNVKYLYAAVFSDEERRQIAAAFQLFISKLMNAAPQMDAIPQAAQPVTPTNPAPNAPMSTHAVPVRDRWARDRKGNELPNPEGCYSINAHVFKAQRADMTDGRPRLKVAFDSPAGQGSQDASCWDEKLFPFIAAQSKEPKATLHIVKKGNYLNIVGVRA